MPATYWYKANRLVQTIWRVVPTYKLPCHHTIACGQLLFRSPKPRSAAGLKSAARSGIVFAPGVCDCAFREESAITSMIHVAAPNIVRVPDFTAIDYLVLMMLSRNSFEHV